LIRLKDGVFTRYPAAQSANRGVTLQTEAFTAVSRLFSGTIKSGENTP
jgi:hypothetical protein